VCEGARKNNNKNAMGLGGRGSSENTGRQPE
jgi:hypothetical protein